ncbi:MAG: Y-family DNA polymerase [Thermoguttaceae bacterium]|nr:Y-family DNA polymerase [Thermoguttaceae bacterium]
MKIVGLLDCNSFFASCEKVFHPAWEHRPVVVLSNNDGCVVARSPEAKKLGIAMGVPYFQIKNFAAANNIVVCSSNYSLYGDMSHRVMQTITKWTADVEIYSIDESFLDLTGRFLRCGQRAEVEWSLELEDELAKLAREIVETVPRWTGIPVAFGLGPTKTLAKAANRIAKKRDDHFCSLLDAGQRDELLKTLDIADVWGVGRNLLTQFTRLGLASAFDLARVDPLWMRQNYSVVQEKLVRELRGERCLELIELPQPRQNIQVSRSFGRMLESLDELEQALATFASRGALRLRKEKTVASALCVQLYTNRFRTDLPQYMPAMTIGFGRPTNSTPEIISLALSIGRQIWREGYAYKRAKILLLDTVNETVACQQKMLFEPDTKYNDERREKERCLMQAVDLINRRAGQGRLFFAAEGTTPAWQPNQAFVSPCYTTRWEDIPTAK